MYRFCNKVFTPAILSALTFSAVTLAAPVYAQDTTASADTSVSIVATDAERFSIALQDLFANGGKELSDIAKYYSSHDYQPIWANGNPKSMLELLTAVEQAPHHGLPLSRYNTPELELLWAAADTPEGLAALEIAAAQSYVKFATEISSGMLNPRGIDVEMNATRKVPKPSDVLMQIAAATDLASFYATLPPSSFEYARLLELKKDLEALLSSEGWGPKVPAGRTLRPGQSSDRVVSLRERLNTRGYELTDLTSQAYGDDVVAAVKAFQSDFGLNSDGLVGPQTLASINAQPDNRLRQLIVNLERARWMNYDLGSRHIYVNIPDFTASVMDNGSSTLSFRVVVGTGEHQTAEFSDVMTHMMANPNWNVPYSIASEEYLPQLMSDPTVLARNNIKMTVRGSGQLVDPSGIDYTMFNEDNFPFFLQQQPGAGNALGRVKFMFPNKYNIYLHDTPAKSLFARDARAYSHGCVRVQKPMELAYTLLSAQESDPQGVFHRALATGKETRLDLRTPIPVHIVYRTVWIEPNGEVHYRHDVYGRDALVYDALVAAGVTLSALGG